MHAYRMTFQVFATALAMSAFVSCSESNQADSDEHNHDSDSAFVEATGDEVPACCADEGPIVRDLTAERTEDSVEEPVPSQTESNLSTPEELDSELVAKVGSIQTSVDPDISPTIIGRKVDFDLNFVNQDGEPINLATDYAGKTIVISTIFTSCPTPEACPRIADDFAEMARQLPDELADDIQLVLVSFDPANDTPKVLHLWGRQHDIDFDRVDLLVGEVEELKKLMLDQLEIPISIDPESDRFMNHALMVHVINPEGFVVVERTAKTSATLKTVREEAIRAATMEFIAPESSG